MVWGISLKKTSTAIFSIRKRLIVSTVSATMILILLSWVMIYNETKHEIDEVYDARLGQSAKIIALSIPSLFTEDNSDSIAHYKTWFKQLLQASEGDSDDPTQYGHPYEQNIIFQFYANNEMLFNSPSSPTKLLGKVGLDGFGTSIENNEEWRYFQLTIPFKINDKAIFIVAEKRQIRDEIVNEIAVSTGVPQLVLIPAFMVIFIFLINTFLRPIDELRLVISQRGIDCLDEIKVPTATTELMPLISQLNYLFVELDNAWQREKRLTRTAAHELKTPLAILKLNVENALHSENEAQLTNDLNNILSGIDRLDRLIQQLLMLSRIEAQSLHNIKFQKMDMVKCLQETIGALVPLALKQQQDISLDAPKHCDVQGNPMLLSILFSNLIDNAIRYSGNNSKIEVQLVTPTAACNNITILISDNGKAIPTEISAKIFESFFRAHTEKGDGAGLGMSIANDITKLHQGSLTLLENPSSKGNTFEVIFRCMRA